MRDKDLYAQILGIGSPWRVADVELALGSGQVKVHVEIEPGTELTCPRCGEASPGYDKRVREWRHLDTCQYQTILSAQVPRVKCPTHGVCQVDVPWAESGSGFTALFEALVIDWLKETSISAVSRQLGLGWSAIDGIMHRAVRRGLARRDREVTWEYLGVDEVSFRKGHDYVGVVSDQERGYVIHVADDRKKENLKAFYADLNTQQKASVISIAMDMWPGFINATLESIPGAAQKIAFDKFHVAKHLGDAVNRVRRQEHKVLLQAGESVLKGSKYLWQRNPENMDHRQWSAFRALRESTLKTARAWAIKELGMSLWHYVSRTWAKKAWKRWYDWAIRSRLEPVKKVARMIKKHLWGIINAIVLHTNNAPAESLNSKIKTIKVRSRGFRNKERFKNAIYFHLGGLDLYPDGIA
jgi:transposase